VEEKTNSRNTRERTPVGGGCLTGQTRGGPLLAAAGELLLKQPPELSHPVCFVSNALHNHFRAFSNNSTGKYGKSRVVLSVGSGTDSADDTHLAIFFPHQFKILE